MSPAAWMALGLLLSGCTPGAWDRQRDRTREAHQRTLARIRGERAVYERDEAVIRAELAEAELAEARARAEILRVLSAAPSPDQADMAAAEAAP